MAAAATAKDDCPSYTIVETDQKGRKKSRVTRVWTEHLTEYQDKTTTFSGPPMGYVGKCDKNSHEIDFFMELFGDTADFIVSRTNTFMEERDDRPKRSKRNSQPAVQLQPVAVKAGTSSDPQPAHTDDDGHHSDLVHEHESSSSSDYEKDMEEDEGDDLDADRLSEASSGTEDQPGTEQDETAVTSTGPPPPPPSPPSPASSQPSSPDVSWSRSSTSQSRKCLRVLVKVTIIFHRLCLLWFVTDQCTKLLIRSLYFTLLAEVRRTQTAAAEAKEEEGTTTAPSPLFYIVFGRGES